MLNEILYSSCISCKTKIEFNKLFCYTCEQSFYRIKFFCENCGWPLNLPSSFCKHCLEQRDFDYIYFMYFYKGPIKALVKEIKFKNNIRAMCYFMKLLNKLPLNIKIKYDLIIPIPSHWLRKLTRLKHPTDIITSILSKKLNIPIKKILKRKRLTSYQWKLHRKERFKNVKGTFTLVRDVKHLKLLLVDDIYTTGATISEAAKLLKESGCTKIDCFVFSKSFYE